MDVENLTIDQIQAMGPSQVLDALDACIVATCALAREAISAETELAAVEIAWARQDGRFLSKGEYLSARIGARLIIKVASLRNSTLK
ncbi:MAG: hypothetical protein M3N13_09905, partial [Candidatus Eremiobacteraeota bacterium]|nr:hypothetical protein [Candidatus Eremiobacteraeota bacterium]